MRPEAKAVIGSEMASLELGGGGGSSMSPPTEVSLTAFLEGDGAVCAHRKSFSSNDSSKEGLGQTVSYLKKIPSEVSILT